MADYYSVISRAVAALELNNFEERRAIYDRARAAQLQQLGPCNKANFDRERSMLEDAITRVEAKATNNRIIGYAPQNARVRPAGATRLTPVRPVRFWLKSVLRRLWRD